MSSDNPQQFVKQPIPIWAIQWTGKNTSMIKAFTESQYHRNITRGNDLPGGIAWFVKRTGTHMTKKLWENISDGQDWGPDITAAIYDYLHETYVGVKTGQWIMCGTKGEFYPCDDNGDDTAPLNYALAVVNMAKED